MTTSIDADRSASLRPTGIGRYFAAAFLLVWLVGWAIGEVGALGFLIMLLRSVMGSAVGLSWPIPGGQWIAGGAAGFVLLFLLLWLSLWTFGGLAAINELLRSLAGEDRITADGTGIQVVRRAGLFERVRTFDRSMIRRVRMRRHDKAVVIDTTSGTELITTYGTRDERQTTIQWLRNQLSLAADGRRVESGEAPPGWNMTVDADSVRLNQMDVRTRRTGATISWVIVGFTGLIWVGSVQTSTPASRAMALALTLLLALWAAWVTWSSREWLVQNGQLTSYRRFAFWEWERRFWTARLEVVVSTDSDNDEHYKLRVIDELGARTIASELNDDADIVDLARWLAARTGFPLSISAAVDSRPRVVSCQM
jgi:hypothetical protein